MNLTEIIRRASPPEPWAEGDNLPWNEPEFSARMLAEHLSQAHDAASRRSETVDRHVAWIYGHVLGGKPARVLDLGCGPGLYTSRLARLGCECVGVDWAPAAITYAREAAARDALACRYLQQDVRSADYGAGFDLAMMLFGEFNVFSPEDVRRILRKARAALREGGTLLLEPHTMEGVRQIGLASPAWSAHPTGLFSERPHLLLQESHWRPEHRIAVMRWYVVDAETAAVARYSASYQAYADGEYVALLRECGFADARFFPSLTGKPDGGTEGLMALSAIARADTRV